MTDQLIEECDAEVGFSTKNTILQTRNTKHETLNPKPKHYTLNPNTISLELVRRRLASEVQHNTRPPPPNSLSLSLSLNSLSLSLSLNLTLTLTDHFVGDSDAEVGAHQIDADDARGGHAQDTPETLSLCLSHTHSITHTQTHSLSL